MAQLQRRSFKSSRLDWDAVQASSRGILQKSPSLNYIQAAAEAIWHRTYPVCYRELDPSCLCVNIAC